jgi:hypothetical protein
MLKSPLGCFLFTLVLYLGCANAPAQELQMVAPPIPQIIPTPPPDPDTLPVPQLQWDPLTPKGADDQGASLATEPVVAAEAEAPMEPPPPPVIDPIVPGLPDPARVELVQPDVEVWRQQSESPQVPARRFNRLEQAFVTGTEPVTLRVQFSPAAAGKEVYVRPGRGVSIGTNGGGALTVSTTGECLVAVQLEDGFSRSHIIFYCEGVKTVLPVMRASLATVIQAEEEGGR